MLFYCRGLFLFKCYQIASYELDDKAMQYIQGQFFRKCTRCIHRSSMMKKHNMHKTLMMAALSLCNRSFNQKSQRHPYIHFHSVFTMYNTFITVIHVQPTLPRPPFTSVYRAYQSAAHPPRPTVHVAAAFALSSAQLAFPSAAI